MLVPERIACCVWVSLLFPDICALCTDYTDLSMGMVTQTQAIPYTGPISLLVSQLRNLAGKKAANLTWTHLTRVIQSKT